MVILIQPETILRLGILPAERDFKTALDMYRSDFFRWMTIIGNNEKFGTYDDSRKFLVVASYDKAYQPPKYSYNVLVTITSEDPIINSSEILNFERMTGIPLHIPNKTNYFNNISNAMSQTFPQFKNIGRERILQTIKSVRGFN